jgi:hypothetical protein
MANEWTWLRGPKQVITCPTETTIAKGAPCYLSSNLIVVCADGGSVDVVCDKDCVSGDTAVPCIVPDGDIFLAKAAVGTDFAYGARAYMAASYTVDAGAAGQTAQAFICNYNPASGGCVDICVTSALRHPLTYGGS